jgi:phosphoglycolate phosphatase-like HAD superfamily hydrolase
MTEVSQLERTSYVPDIPDEMYRLFPEIRDATFRYKEETVIIDLDRTLVDTDLVMNRSYAAVETIVRDPAIETGLLSMMQMKQDRDTSNGISSFQIPDYLQSKVDPKHAERIVQAFLREFVLAEQLAVVYRDAPDFIDRLNHEAIPHMVITRGPELWQEPKVKGTGFATTFYRTAEDTYAKVPAIQLMRDANGMISTWDQTDNVITVTPGSVLIEDTADGLEGVKEDQAIRGIWIWRVDPTDTTDHGYSQLLEKQKGAVQGMIEGRVNVIYSLAQLATKSGRLGIDPDYAYGQEKPRLLTPAPRRLHIPLSPNVRIVAPKPELPSLPHAPVLEIRDRSADTSPMSTEDILAIRNLLLSAT